MKLLWRRVLVIKDLFPFFYRGKFSLCYVPFISHSLWIYMSCLYSLSRSVVLNCCFIFFYFCNRRTERKCEWMFGLRSNELDARSVTSRKSGSSSSGGHVETASPRSLFIINEWMIRVLLLDNVCDFFFQCSDISTIHENYCWILDAVASLSWIHPLK